MKLLCLHGYGTSGEIFEKQLASITRELGDHHEYVYVDGEVPVKKTELAGLFSGETLAFYEGHSSQNVEKAHELLEDVLASEEEPFDGVIGFSQGAALAISYVLNQQILHPERSPPFRFGVFFTPGGILSPDSYYNEEKMAFLDTLDQGGHDKIITALLDRSNKNDLFVSAETFPELDQLPFRDGRVCLELVKNAQALLHTRDLLHVDEGIVANDMDHLQQHSDMRREFPRFFNPIYTTERVPFPTVHINGYHDPAPNCLADYAKGLCVSKSLISVVTQCGHEIPTRRDCVIEIVRAMEKAYFLGQRM